VYEPKVYVITRQDLNPGYQLVQSCHAIREFDAKYPDYKSIANLACLSAPDEVALDNLIGDCISEGIRHAIFREPDVGDQITAIAIEPGERSRRLLSRLPLALK
jgi:hypothetical protein